MDVGWCDMPSLRELEVEIKKFCAERDWDQYHMAKDLAMAANLNDQT